MPIITASIIGGGAAIGAGLIGANAAGNAADKQAQAAAEASRGSSAQFERSRADLQPFLSTGVQANQTLANLLGLGAPQRLDASQAYLKRYGDVAGSSYFGGDPSGHYNQYGQREGRTWGGETDAEYRARTGVDPNAPTNANTGSLLQPFTGADVANEPGYQFGMQQGELGLERRGAASGMRLSPATQKALARFNQDYAGTKFGEAFNRDLTQKQFTYNTLSGLSDQGRGAANATAALGQNTANQIGENTMGAGNAQAAGTVGAANAYGGALTGAANQFMNYAMLDQFLKGGNRGGGGWNAGNSQYMP